jgi:pSer/pThr/pTyr-binding forkhead associated (FHA) protein
MAEATVTCPSCGSETPSGFRFCGNCGVSLAHRQSEPEGGAQTLYFGAMQQPNRAKLILIKGEGLDGVSYVLNADEHLAGRSEGEVRFEDDPLLSPRHATFFYEDGRLVVRDEGSVNGVFVRIRDGIAVNPGATFLVGEQLIRLEAVNPDDMKPEADIDGTLLYGSPRRPGFFKLVQILRGGATGMIFRAPTPKVALGREGNDINFPDDPFISGQHALVSVEGTNFMLTDLGSKNGTFVRIERPQVLYHGDYVFIGQQLLRVEIV